MLKQLLEALISLLRSAKVPSPTFKTSRLSGTPSGGTGGLNRASIDLIKRWEGLRLEAYRDSAGYWTIGYGWAETNGMLPKPRAGLKITKQEAEDLLVRGLKIFTKEVDNLLTRTPTANQRGAMVSLAYNIGLGSFRKSTCLRRFNKGDIEGSATALLWFNKAGGRVLKGLENRRAAERALFLS